MGDGAPLAAVGIAGVNTHPLHAATLGIAGNWGSTLRPYVQHITTRSPLATSGRLGDRAASCERRFKNGTGAGIKLGQ